MKYFIALALALITAAFVVGVWLWGVDEDAKGKGSIMETHQQELAAEFFHRSDRLSMDDSKRGEERSNVLKDPPDERTEGFRVMDNFEEQISGQVDDQMDAPEAVSETFVAEAGEVEREMHREEEVYFDVTELRALQEGGQDTFAPSAQHHIAPQSRQSDPVIEDAREKPVPAENQAQTGLPAVGGQARGYVMLYAMQPEARATVEAQLGALLEANIRDVYFSVLTDGTFSRDFAYLSSILERLGRAERNITLVLYLTNGPTMRDFDRTDIEAGFNRIDPIEFRELIKSDAVIRQRFQAKAREVRSILELNKALGPNNRNLVAVMLEDNLDVSSYVAMRDLAFPVLGDVADFIRNPCPGCYAGNDWDPAGDYLELHSAETLHALRQGDGFTTDGESYYFEDQESSVTGLSLEELKFLKDQSMQRGVSYFGLWRKERQGLYNAERPHPSHRIYEVPTPRQLRREIELMRYGLSALEADHESEIK